MSEKMVVSSVQETVSTIVNRRDGSTRKRHENETKDGKVEGEDGMNERNKFKKVETLVFNGEDPDSWLFRANRYFSDTQID